MTKGSKAKILQVARELFYRGGYLATSVDDILQLAKVSKSNFYYHFKSKEDLGIAVLQERCEEFEKALAATLLNESISPCRRLQGFLSVLAQSHSDDDPGGCPFGNLVAEMSQHSERFRRHLSDMFSGLTDTIGGVVEEGQRAGEFRKDVDAPSVGALIVQAIQGAELLAKCHKTREAGVQGIETLLRLLEPA